MSFEIGDYAVCPGHGVGQIVDIEQKELSVGVSTAFYIIKLFSNGMKVMVPRNGREQIRELVADNDVNDMFDLLSDHSVKVSNSTWNRRYREYMEKIKSGSLLEIADVMRSLFILKGNKGLSFGEKKMIEQCKGLIVEEVSLAGVMEKNDCTERINQTLC